MGDPVLGDEHRSLNRNEVSCYVYQLGGSGGVVKNGQVYDYVLSQAKTQDRYAGIDWYVTHSSSFTSCEAGGFISSSSGSCPESPDGEGCDGRWKEIIFDDIELFDLIDTAIEIGISISL